MSKVRITMVQADGEEVVIENATMGQSLMVVAKAHGVDGILGDCGGGCACATCQISVRPELDGLKVTVAPSA